MIKSCHINPTEAGFAEMVMQFRTSVRSPFTEVKKSFRRMVDAKIEYNKEKKRILTEQVTNYVAHCENVYSASGFTNPGKWQSIFKCKELVKFCKGGNGEKSLKEMATYILMNKKNLKHILPNQLNSGYATAEGNLNEVIVQAQYYSGKRRVTQI